LANGVNRCPASRLPNRQETKETASEQAFALVLPASAGQPMPGGATRNEGVPGSSPGVGFRQRPGPSSPLRTSGSTASTSRKGRDAEFNEYVLKLGEGVNHFAAVARGKAADAAAAPLGFG
jgi:hypothetical protein